MQAGLDKKMGDRKIVIFLSPIFVYIETTRQSDGQTTRQSEPRVSGLLLIVWLSDRLIVSALYFARFAVNSTGGISRPSMVRVNLISSPDTLPL